VYLGSAFQAILAILAFCGINNLRVFNAGDVPSPVVPAIPFKHLQGIGKFAHGPI
jgi:hypothetical protein